MDWKKEWIWTKGEKDPRNSYAYFRGWFTVRKGVEQVSLSITADSRYLLYLNGAYSGRGPAKCDPKYQYYDSYDLTGKSVRGKNLLAVLVHHYGEETFSYILGRGGFLCQVEVSYPGGRCEIFGSDHSWRTKKADAWDKNALRTSVQMGFQEIYDARQAPLNWPEPDFDDAGWQDPAVLGKPPIQPWTSLTARDIPFLKEELIWPQNVVETGEIAEPGNLDNQNLAELLEKELHLPFAVKKNAGLIKTFQKDGNCWETAVSENGLYLILDFGKEVTGFPNFTLETKENTGLVDLAYDELLFSNRPHPKRVGEKFHCADRYFTRPGKITYQNSFTWRGFRYLMLVLRKFRKPVRIHSIGLNSYTYPVIPAGTFSSSDHLTNRIWEISRYTLSLCMHDSYEDCPWREQAQWCGDFLVESLANYYAFGDLKLIRKGLLQIAQSQERRSDGLMLPFAPGGIHGSSVFPRPIRVIPAFCLVWILALKDYWLFSGDDRSLKELYPYLTRLLNGFGKFLTKRNLLIFDKEYWNFVDWTGLDCEGETTALNCFFIGALKAAAEIADNQNDRISKEKYLTLTEKVRQAVNRHLWNAEKGLYADGIRGNELSRVYSQHSNVLAILFDVTQDRPALLKKILTDKDLVGIASPYFMFYLLAALFKEHEFQTAYQVIRRRWGEMISQGATTFWEVFEGASKPDQAWSLCHAWSASPASFLLSEFLGVKPLLPGFKKVAIEPQAAGPKWIKGRIPTPHGRITVHWQREPEYRIEIKLPGKIDGVLKLPDGRNFEFRGSFKL